MVNWLNFSKNKYPIKGINIVILILYCVLFFSGIVVWSIYLFKYLPKAFLYIYIYIITLLAYTYLYYLKNQQFLQMEYVSHHSKKCMRRTKKCLYYLFYLILIMIMCEVFPLKIDGSDLYNLSILYFVGIVGYMLMNYQFIVGFGEIGYISGDGKIFYEEIDKIEEIKRIQTADGTLVYTKINLFDNKVCYDKFLTEEYIFLVNKIANER